jgi:hypothetical protein
MEAIGVKADISSGDDPHKRSLGTFNPIFPIGNYFGVLVASNPGSMWCAVNPATTIQSVHPASAVSKFFIETSLYPWRWSQSAKAST